MNLLERAAKLLPGNDRLRFELLLDLAGVAISASEFHTAKVALSQTADDPLSKTDSRLQTRTRLQQLHLRSAGGWVQSTDDEAELQELIPLLEERDDDAALAAAWLLAMQGPLSRGRFADAESALWESLKYARHAEDRRQEILALGYLAGSIPQGPMPVPEALDLCEEIERQMRGSKWGHTGVLWGQARLEAMLGQFHEARHKLEEGRMTLEDLGFRGIAATACGIAGPLEMLAGEAHAAKRALATGYATLMELGMVDEAASVIPQLVLVSLSLGETSEAEKFLAAFPASGHDYPISKIPWLSAKAKLLATRGLVPEALEFAYEAVSLSSQTDMLNARGEALGVLAEVLQMADRVPEAISVTEEALHLYEQKGNIVSADKARKSLEELPGGPVDQTSRPP
jgi:tetratricopeptide (TPR) repeat protein